MHGVFSNVTFFQVADSLNDFLYNTAIIKVVQFNYYLLRHDGFWLLAVICSSKEPRRDILPTKYAILISMALLLPPWARCPHSEWQALITLDLKAHSLKKGQSCFYLNLCRLLLRHNINTWSCLYWIYNNKIC